MDSVLNAVAGYISTLVVERLPEVIWVFVVLALWRWFTWHKVRKRIAEIEAEIEAKLDGESTKITLYPGATYNDFRGANGEWHLKANGPIEIVSPRRIPVLPLEVTAPAMKATASVSVRSDESDGR